MTRDEQLDYLAGFFDAEGCVTMTSTRGVPRIAFSATQTDPMVLEQFRSTFGGCIISQERSAPHSRVWRWQKSCRREDEFIPFMQGRLTIKSYALELASMFAKTQYRSGAHPKKKEDVVLRMKVKVMLSKVNSGEFDNHEIEWGKRSLPYWAGLFDGDGMATVSPTSPRVYRPIAQVTSAYMPILKCLQAQFGGFIYSNYRGKGRDRVWRSTSRVAINFLTQIKPFTQTKHDAIERVQKVAEVYGKGRETLRIYPKNGAMTYSDESLAQMETNAQLIIGSFAKKGTRVAA